MRGEGLARKECHTRCGFTRHDGLRVNAAEWEGSVQTRLTRTSGEGSEPLTSWAGDQGSDGAPSSGGKT